MSDDMKQHDARDFDVVFAAMQERLHRLEEAVRAVTGGWSGAQPTVKVTISDWRKGEFLLASEYADNGAQFSMRGTDLNALIDRAFEQMKPFMVEQVRVMGQRARLFGTALGWSEREIVREMNSTFVLGLMAETTNDEKKG